MIYIHNFYSDSKMILYLDFWTIRISWIRIRLLFFCLCPQNYTGIFQPCDVGLQCLFKHSVKQSASKFFIIHVKKERLKGVAPKKIRLPTKLGELRDQTPAWWNSTSRDDIQKPSIGASSWKNHKAGPWNRSYECITSPTALNEWFRLFPEYCTKIEVS